MPRFHLCLIMRSVLLWVALLAGPATLRSAEPETAPPAPAAAATPELNFESGSLSGWLAEGDAFKGQPVQGDLVQARRADMRSGHTGKFWIGTFEVAGDAPKGTLTSAPLKVTQPWASFLVGGGQHRSSRVEIINAKDGQVVYEITGENNETMQPVVLNLAPLVEHEIIVRLVDQSSVGWGHINFDDFRLHAERPKFDNERVPLANDTFSHAGLSQSCSARDLTCGVWVVSQMAAGQLLAGRRNRRGWQTERRAAGRQVRRGVKGLACESLLARADGASFFAQPLRGPGACGCAPAVRRR